ncbi:uncharacterized protein LOC130901353 [Diorhabda carinulata]|uniref:uncharacterized protein LOC130440589 n=1 Tax=Diorhabda sublineata TaxID=1163346 RepID=UPI0024E1568F|nr:uncharacterized protein LOC130440589 [Diorhabda sublineata]XP_057668658.1 uncharacterized protein LOC130901353 [Diorhabda carinulata]
MLSTKYSNIPEEFCRIRTQKPRIREKINYKKWLTANDRQDAILLQEEKMRELRELKRKIGEDFFKVKESALNYKATKRIRDLAQPKAHAKKVTEATTKNSHVKPTALRYMPTKRILELARPKENYISRRPDSF